MTILKLFLALSSPKVSWSLHSLIPMHLTGLNAEFLMLKGVKVFKQVSFDGHIYAITSQFFINFGWMSIL